MISDTVEIEDRLARQSRDDGAAINAVAKSHQALFAHQLAQCSQHLIFAPKIGKFTRQEYVFTLPAGYPTFDPIAQCLLLTHAIFRLQKPDTYIIQKPDNMQG